MRSVIIQVMKIVSTGKTISTPEFRDKKRRVHRRRLIIFSSLIFAFIVLVVMLLRLERFQIQTIVVSGALVTGSDKVTSAVEEALSGRYFWLLPKRSAPIYPNGQVEAELARRFPRFSSVSLALNGFNELDAEVVEREPFALYCADVCYFLDKEGFIFDYSPTFSEGVYFVYASEVPPLNPLGTRFVPPEEFAALSKFIEKIDALGILPRLLTISLSDARLQLEDGGEIIWRRGTDFAHVQSNFESFLGSKEIKGEKDFWQRLETLDLRTGNKVFYRFREGQ